ncbi:hypothetical protein C173_14200 [Paenibacillus sp. FSL R7-277]|nr:hypothetical protein C173_14200 [Paenibacillus sp. FSL R7-277]
MIIVAFLNLVVIHLTPVEKRPLLHIVWIEQLHFDADPFALSRLGLDVQNRLLLCDYIMAELRVVDKASPFGPHILLFCPQSSIKHTAKTMRSLVLLRNGCPPRRDAA